MAVPECSVCHLPFGGRDRRHHGCPFCSRTFSRVDGVKRHVKSCPSRDSRPIPDDTKRGRKRHACDMCAKVKVSCDSKTPCSRCASRNLSCSYGRFCTDSSHLAQAHTNSTKADGMDLTFLLACTDPAVGTVDEVILTGEPERDGDNATSHVDRDVPSGTIDPNLLFLGFMDPYFGTEMEFNRMDDGMPTPLSLDLDMDEALFLTQVSLLEAELRQTAAAERTRSRREFDSDIWASFFTPQNFRECINAFFHRDQLLATIIHRPTFHSDRADSTLLLSIVLSGYSYIQAGSRKGFNPVALALRKIAEEYIFHRVGQHLSPTVASPAPQFALELCQAAYIIVTLQSCVKDAKIRQHVTTKCHPMLVALLRNLDMIGITHARSETSDWRAFIYKESCIRLVHWTFINDAWLNLFSNYPPAMTLLDMSGDLPCDDEFWFMEDPTVAHDTFMEKINSNVQGVSLKLLMSELLGDGWAPSTVALYKQLDVKHFLVAIFAFQHVIFQFESALLPESSFCVVSRGLGRWVELWESALGRLDRKSREQLGLARYSAELAFLLKEMVKLGRVNKGERMNYLERRVQYDTTALHHFIKYCSK